MTSRLEMYSQIAKEKGVRWLTESTWEEIDALNREKTVILFALGPVEQHGPHNPLGLDIFVAEAVTFRLGAFLADLLTGWTILIAPTIPYCMAVLSRNYAGSTSIRRTTVRDLITDVTSSYAFNGFRNQVITSHHIEPGNIVAVDEGCALTNARYGARVIHGYNHLILESLAHAPEDSPFTKLGLSPEEISFELHAGALETSEMLYLNDELVNKERCQELSFNRIPYSDVIRSKSFKTLGNGLGYQGNVQKSSIEIGQFSFETLLASYQELVLRHLHGEDLTDLFRGALWKKSHNHSRDFDQLLEQAITEK